MSAPWATWTTGCHRTVAPLALAVGCPRHRRLVHLSTIIVAESTHLTSLAPLPGGIAALRGTASDFDLDEPETVHVCLLIFLCVGVTCMDSCRSRNRWWRYTVNDERHIARSQPFDLTTDSRHVTTFPNTTERFDATDKHNNNDRVMATSIV